MSAIGYNALPEEVAMMTQQVPKWFDGFKSVLRQRAMGVPRCKVEIPEEPGNLGVQLASAFAKELRNDFRVLYYEWQREGDLRRHFLVAEFGPFCPTATLRPEKEAVPQPS